MWNLAILIRCWQNLNESVFKCEQTLIMVIIGLLCYTVGFKKKRELSEKILSDLKRPFRV
jgi:hypothetical protein